MSHPIIEYPDALEALLSEFSSELDEPLFELSKSLGLLDAIEQEAKKHKYHLNDLQAGPYDLVSLIIAKLNSHNAMLANQNAAGGIEESEGYQDKIKLLKACFQKEMSANNITKQGWPPLYYAVFYNAKQIITLLLHHGADVHQRCDEKTLLHIARFNQDMEVIKLLVQQGVDINIQDERGNTAQNYMAVNGPAWTYLKEAKAVLEEQAALKKALGMDPLIGLSTGGQDQDKRQEPDQSSARKAKTL